jgi:hypothetical protein
MSSSASAKLFVGMYDGRWVPYGIRPRFASICDGSYSPRKRELMRGCVHSAYASPFPPRSWRSSRMPRSSSIDRSFIHDSIPSRIEEQIRLRTR